MENKPPEINLLNPIVLSEESVEIADDPYEWIYPGDDNGDFKESLCKKEFFMGWNFWLVKLKGVPLYRLVDANWIKHKNRKEKLSLWARIKRIKYRIVRWVLMRLTNTSLTA